MNSGSNNPNRKTQDLPPSSSNRVNGTAASSHADLKKMEYSPYLPLQKARFVTKKGLPIEKDVVPPLPIQTASAAAPARHFVQQESDRPSSDLPSSAPTQGLGALSGEPDLAMPARSNRESAPPHGPTISAPPYHFPYMQSGSPAASLEGKDSSSLHAFLIGLILIAGLVVGLGGTWWAKQKNSFDFDLSGASSSADSESSSMPSRDTNTNRRSALVIPPEDKALISPDEKLQRQHNSDEKAEALAAIPSTKIEPDTSSFSPALPVSPVEEPILDQDSDSLPGEYADKKEPSVPAPEAPAKAAVTKKASKNTPPKQAQKTASVSAKDRSKEIDRLRSQAFSETRKESLGNSKANSPASELSPQSQNRRGSRSTQRASDTRGATAYARCERVPDLISREICKWQACGNKWGRDGCPSFKSKKDAYTF